MLFRPPRPCTPSQLSSNDNTWRSVSGLLGLLGLLPFDMRDLKEKKRKKKKKRRRRRSSKRRKQKGTRHYVQDKRNCFEYS